jgi:hypothetical protein
MQPHYYMVRIDVSLKAPDVLVLEMQAKESLSNFPVYLRCDAGFLKNVIVP